MKYYQYISDSKVDMLLPQIPLEAKQKITPEIGFDIKIVSGKIKTERDSLDDRVSRLLVVERYIRNTQRIGSLLDPAPWISDSQEFDVGFFPDEPNMLGYIGNIGYNYFLLAGSAGNIVGCRPDNAQIGCGYSFFATVN